MKTITGIHGVPRSGTSWLAQIFNASPDVRLKFQPLFSYAFKNALNENSSQDEVLNFFENIYISNDDFINMRDTKLLKDYPVFEKKRTQPHLVFKHVRYHYVLPNMMKKNKNLKLVLVIRNPLAVISSWKNAPREFNEEWDINEEWQFARKKNLDKADYFGYEKWKETSLLFLKLKDEYSDRVSIVNYKYLLENTLEEVEQLFRFTGIEMNEQVLKFVFNSKTKEIDDPNSVFKIKKNDDAYKKNVPLKIQDQIINDLKGTKLAIFLD